MKRTLLATAALAVLAVPTQAADLRRPAPVKAAPTPVHVTAYRWTGCYVGAGGGYGMFNQETQFLGSTANPVPNDNAGRGWFGTVQVGCDYQAASSWVIGAFADYDFSGIKGDISVPVATWVGQDEKLRSSWAVGGRVGWFPLRQFLVFASGGYTQAEFNQVNFLDVGIGNPFPANVALAKHTYSGWFLGAGYEYGIGWLPGLFWKTEYRFADYGTDRVPLLSTFTGAPTGNSLDLHKRVQTVRSELVWRFWSGGAASTGEPRRAMPLKAAPPAAPVSVASWTGCYVGAGGGYGLFHQESQYVIPAPFGLSHDNGGHGWFGTVQGGCDYQFRPAFLVGAFVDYDFSGIKGDLSVPPQVWTGDEKLKSSWAAGGRIGWLPFPQLLTFVSGGYSEARFGEVTFLAATSGTPVDVILPEHTYSGWFLGSGYEYGIGLLPGLFWKTEYRLANYGTDTVPLVSTFTGAPRGDALELQKRVHTVRSELVWRFSSGGPVVARH